MQDKDRDQSKEFFRLDAHLGKGSVSRNPMCLHGIRKSRCVKCGGGGVCTHGKQNGQCITCCKLYGHGIGKFFCIHEKQARKCKTCKNNQPQIAFASAQGSAQASGAFEHDFVWTPPGLEAALAPGLEAAAPGSEAALAPGLEAAAPESEAEFFHPFDDVFGEGAFSYDLNWTPGSAPGSVPGSAPGSAPGSVSGSPRSTLPFTSDYWENQGGKKRKKRFTRRLRRNHNTKKKNKLVKRKVIKHSRKNKYKRTQSNQNKMF
jgi:hypothetical protein